MCARRSAFFLAIFLYLIIREESLKYARKKKEIRQQKKEVETPTSQRERERERESERERERERDALFADRDALFFAATQFLLHPRARRKVGETDFVFEFYRYDDAKHGVGYRDGSSGDIR